MLVPFPHKSSSFFVIDLLMVFVTVFLSMFDKNWNYRLRRSSSLFLNVRSCSTGGDFEMSSTVLVDDVPLFN